MLLPYNYGGIRRIQRQSRPNQNTQQCPVTEKGMVEAELAKDHKARWESSFRMGWRTWSQRAFPGGQEVKTPKARFEACSTELAMMQRNAPL